MPLRLSFTYCPIFPATIHCRTNTHKHTHKRLSRFMLTHEHSASQHTCDSGARVCACVCALARELGAGTRNLNPEKDCCSTCTRDIHTHPIIQHDFHMCMISRMVTFNYKRAAISLSLALSTVKKIKNSSHVNRACKHTNLTPQRRKPIGTQLTGCPPKQNTLTHAHNFKTAPS